MLPLHVVDDHGQFNHPILRTLRDVDILTTMIATDTSRHPHRPAARAWTAPGLPPATSTITVVSRRATLSGCRMLMTP